MDFYYSATALLHCLLSMLSGLRMRAKLSTNFHWICLCAWVLWTLKAVTLQELTTPRNKGLRWVRGLVDTPALWSSSTIFHDINQRKMLEEEKVEKKVLLIFIFTIVNFMIHNWCRHLSYSMLFMQICIHFQFNYVNFMLS